MKYCFKKLALHETQTKAISLVFLGNFVCIILGEPGCDVDQIN